jgi:2-polyprenyl-6-methoxyphenol hydroxylase-like FAD-dependent oxidoreductase
MHSAGGQRKRAVVIGGSIGGLFAGLFLSKVGWDLSIHECAGEELASRGAGIATHDDLHEALALVTEPGEEVGVAVEGSIVLARSGDVVCEVARPQVLASWDRIWQRLRLRAGDVCRHGSALVSVVLDEQRAVARFDDGSEVAADLLVAADGIQSTVRRQLLPAVACTSRRHFSLARLIRCRIAPTSLSASGALLRIMRTRIGRAPSKRRWRSATRLT